MLVLEAGGLVGGLLQLSTCPRDPLEAGNGQLVQEASTVGSLWVGQTRGQVSYGAGAQDGTKVCTWRTTPSASSRPLPLRSWRSSPIPPSRPRYPPAERESDCLLAAGSSSNGAREAREWIERRGGPTSDSLQLRACIRARPMECRDRETSNRPCWRLLSLAELDNRWQSSKFPRIAKLRAPTTNAPGSTAAE